MAGGGLGALNLVSYLEELPPVKLTQIYDSHWTCQAVLRSLPPVAKHYVLRLLFVNSAVPENILRSWAQVNAQSKHDSALDALQRLQLLKTQPDRSGGVLFTLHTAFQEQLQLALCLRQTESGVVPAGVAASAPSTDEVSEYSRRQWDALLLYLVGASKDLPSAPSYMEAKRLDVVRLLIGAGLMNESDRSVTQAGFQFLLSDTYHQMWRLLREYISTAERASGADLSAVIGFLLQLGFRSEPCNLLDFLAEEQAMAADMAALGVLCPFKGVDGQVYVVPTMLASSISAAGGAGAKAVDGYIIVESNFKVYAYTSSAIRISILKLFIRMEVLLPNLVVGSITRESIASALSSGITAQQLVTYLRQHVSPFVANRVPAIPETVADQIQLWENEQNRVRHHEACLFDDFNSADMFGKTCKYAHQIGVWLWQDDTKRRLVTRMSGSEEMKQFIRANKSKT